MKNNVLSFNNVYISDSSAIVGKKEYEGPIGESFDAYEQDEYFGCKSFEEAESEMVRRNLNLLLGKANKNFDDIDIIMGGDLINQCTVSSFAVCGEKVPFLGLYGACSTIIEAIINASVFIDGGFVNTAIGMASSHFCSSERQYRFPLEYGSIRTPTSQHTVTGAGAVLLTKERSEISVKGAVIGRIVDKGITDANNMGAAMACAAVDTIKRFFNNSNMCPEDFDIISTGDLGIEGHSIAREMLNLEGIPIGNNFTDCGMLIYDKKKQDTHSGGSGCGCIASVLCGHFMKMLNKKEIKNILAVGTGALLNPNSVFQQRNIPAIAHAVHISAEV
ncbi:MAG: stage V sporulation protein AD [Ruminococcaceae bacterium]|nr:stage V sporulation protein AD [Oscillospiraceae bacterium]